MSPINRREFAVTLALSLGARSLPGAVKLDNTMRTAMNRRKIPAAVAMAATADKTIYEGAFGKRDSASDVDVTMGTLFRTASTTRAITTGAAMPLAEPDTPTLEDPASMPVPELD